MRHIRSLVIMRSLDTRKYADKRVSIKSEVVENFELKNKTNQRFHRPTHGSVCSDVRKLQSMDVLRLQSTKADWNTKCPFHILAYIDINLLDISTSYFSKILSYRERLDVDS